MTQDPRKNPDLLQNLIDLSPAHRQRDIIKKVHNFLRYFAHRHTDHHKKHNLLGEGNGWLITGGKSKSLSSMVN